jgi:hypothetical protein
VRAFPSPKDDDEPPIGADLYVVVIEIQAVETLSNGKPRRILHVLDETTSACEHFELALMGLHATLPDWIDDAETVSKATPLVLSALNVKVKYFNGRFRGTAWDNLTSVEWAAPTSCGHAKSLVNDCVTTEALPKDAAPPPTTELEGMKRAAPKTTAEAAETKRAKSMAT